jgi:hypothetical protein
MRRGRARADSPGMETRTGRFQRSHPFVRTRRGLKGEVLALRHELELLDEALSAGHAPHAAHAALGYAFTHLRAAERAWQELRRPADLWLVIAQIDASRDALEASVAARRSAERARV